MSGPTPVMDGKDGDGRTTHLSLFSGYEGFGLGLRLAGLPIRTIGYVEIDEYCQRLIQARIRDGLLDWAPIVRDIRRADFRRLAGLVGLITAGFPCQPHSAAGLRAGASDDRNLWPETAGAIRDVGPRWVLLENVPGILANRYAGTVVGELASLGYDSIGDRVPAAAVGAPHLRWRWFCLSDAAGLGRPGRGRPSEPGDEREEMERGQFVGPDGAARTVADADGAWEQQPGGAFGEERERAADSGPALAVPWSQRRGERPGFSLPRQGETFPSPPDGGPDVADAPGPRREARKPGEGGEGDEQPGRRLPEPERRGGPVADAGGFGLRAAEPYLSEGESNALGGREEGVPTAGDPAAETGAGGPRTSAQSSFGIGASHDLGIGNEEWWAVEPALGRVADGTADRVDQLRALGNGIVPAVVRKFLRGR